MAVDGEGLHISRVMDDYLCSFLESVNYTENCYSCRFASKERVADITIGDSWGTELKIEEKNGISLILIQSEKGKKLLNESGLNLYDVDLDTAILNNRQLTAPSIKSSKRERFLYMLERGSSYKLATFISLPKLVLKQKLKSILVKMHVLKNGGDCPKTRADCRIIV